MGIIAFNDVTEIQNAILRTISAYTIRFMKAEFNNLLEPQSCLIDELPVDTPKITPNAMNLDDGTKVTNKGTKNEKSSACSSSNVSPIPQQNIAPLPILLANKEEPQYTDLQSRWFI